jgi:hypothetical protein
LLNNKPKTLSRLVKTLKKLYEKKLKAVMENILPMILHERDLV